MPDITKCTGDNCPLRDDCYRYTSRPSEMQSYLSTAPWYWEHTDDGYDNLTCEFYMPHMTQEDSK